MIKHLNILIVLCFLSVPALAYIVKPGDTLSKIAAKFYAGKVHGKGGAIEKIIADNPQIKNNIINPGMELKLNKKYMKEDVVDPDEDVVATDKGDKDDENDADAGLNPLIEVEHFDDKKGFVFKDAVSDKINFYVDFELNNFQATDQLTQNDFNFTTSTETNVGLEYVKNISEMTNVFVKLGMNHYAVSAVSTLIPQLDASEKAQATGALGIRLRFTADSILNFGVDYKPHYFLLVDPKTGHVYLDHPPSISYNLSTENFFYHNKDYVVGLDLGLDYIANPQKNTGKGLDATISYNAGFIFQQEYKSNDKIKVKLNYIFTELDTSSYKLEDRTLALSFLYSLPY